MRIVYIAGPYSIGDKIKNVNRAIWYGMRLIERGHAVIVPHLSHFIDVVYPINYKTWLKMDLVLLDKCDVVYRIEGDSKGADIEVDFALANNKPVFYDFSKLCNYLNKISPSLKED